MRRPTPRHDVALAGPRAAAASTHAGFDFAGWLLAIAKREADGGATLGQQFDDAAADAA